MNIAIVGIGGVGGYYGGRLAFRYGAGSGHSVHFVARGEHLRKIREQGLRVVTTDGEFTARPASATDRPEELGSLDLVLVTVKTYSLEEAAAALRGVTGKNTVVIPLENGVDNAERLKAVLPQARVLNGTVYISSRIVEPGVVQQLGGACSLLFGPEGGPVEPFRALETLFIDAGIKAVLTGAIAAEVWKKYLFISPVAGATALHDKTLGGVLEDGQARRLLEGMMNEVDRIARAKGVDLAEDAVSQALETVARFPHGTKTSFQVDVEKGAKTEIETFMGYVVRQGRALGIETPFNLLVYEALSKK
jgi:2-dehydropantoate 2-reductase